MKRMNMMVLTLALCVGSQAYGWLIVFDPANAFNRKYDVLTFVSQEDYKKMLIQESAGMAVNGALLKIAPLADKALTGATIVATVTGQEYVDVIDAVAQGTNIFKKLYTLGKLKNKFNALTEKGYTIENVDNAGPGPGRNWLCKSADTQANNKWHKIKQNQLIYFVIKDSVTNEVLYSDWGWAYGYYVFRIGKVKNADTGAEQTVGDLSLISGTKTANGQTIDPKSEGQLCPDEKKDLNLSTTVPIKLTQTKSP